jgi:Fe(3+) dicitrate transport protein
MKLLSYSFTVLLIHYVSAIHGQSDTTKTVTYKDLIISDVKKTIGTGTMGEEKGTWIYAGRKSEVIATDSIGSNKATNNTRELMGRIPGMNVSETETGGFVSNGFGLRGLAPLQSAEMNVRQNGYNVAGDVMGYNEVYYLPPMEAVERIEIVRGAGSLQFGPQFGGMVNYITAQAPKTRKLEWRSSLTGGSYVLINIFNSLGGTLGRFSYYAYCQYRHMDGFRPNNVNDQYLGMGRISYGHGSTYNLSLEYSFLRNKIQMPGGLTDEWFAKDPAASYRPRNWITTPWNIVALNGEFSLSAQTQLSISVSYGHKSRFLIWKNEDGGTAALDTFMPGIGSYVPREVEKETMDNSSAELRVLHHYHIRGREQTLAAGVRAGLSVFHTQEGGMGSCGFDMKFNVDSNGFENEAHFTNANLAVFAENIFRIGRCISITPGLRIEYLHSAVRGYTTVSDTDMVLYADGAKDRAVMLGGVGMEIKPSSFSDIYINVNRAYRPIDYSTLFPFGTVSKIDKSLHDADGYNAELGYRGHRLNMLCWDVNGFLLLYKDKPGTVLETDASGNEYTVRKNVSNSLHLGIESYLELNLIKTISPSSHIGDVRIFNSLAYVHARYTEGIYRGKQVEYAPDIIERAGISYAMRGLTIKTQISYQSRSYGDATNAEYSKGAVAGVIPAYYVLDCSASYSIGRFGICAGLNNVFDSQYFTLRADEYPGPGIMPSIGRNFYLTFVTKL